MIHGLFHRGLYMPDSMLIGCFLLIVFAPCLLAFSGDGFADGAFPEIAHSDKWQMPRWRGLRPLPLQAMHSERALADEFEIRSFPKGLSQRRIVVRDGESGLKLTIAQVRAAAVELIKLGGRAAAYEFALVAAVNAVAMASIKDAVEIAAREAYEAARNAYQWFAWGDVMTQESTVRAAPDETPPVFELQLDLQGPAALARGRAGSVRDCDLVLRTVRDRSRGDAALSSWLASMSSELLAPKRGHTNAEGSTQGSSEAPHRSSSAPYGCGRQA